IIFFFQAEDGIRDHCVTGVQTCALPIWPILWLGVLEAELGKNITMAKLFRSLISMRFGLTSICPETV
ncbi:hypothetical protein SHD_0283, partial [Shewanella decolorationis S12]